MQSFFYICEYLGVTPQEFFDEDNTCPETLKEFMTEARQLDPRSMQYILGIMKDLNGRKQAVTVLAELLQKAQVTIPREIIVKLGLSEGDKMDIFKKDGSICIMPVVGTPCLTNWRRNDGV